MPSGAAASSDSDAHMAIIDDSTGCEYDFWGARRQSDGSWTAASQATFRIGNHGSHEPWSARASGFALGAGLIRPSDVQSGAIEHALAIALPVTAPTFRAPATTSDGRTAGGVPMGTRLQLDPSFNIASLPADQHIIARALQNYGAYVVDTSSAITLYAQNQNSTGSFSYPSSWASGLSNASSILRSLRVIAAPSSPPLDTWTASGCAQMFKG
jgi:hypothetical protein